MMLLPNIWGSITVFAKTLITEVQVDYSAIDIQFIDWETHANIQELPNADLIGPTALTFQEEEANLIQVNFSIGVSTYGSDRNLFRLRDYVGRAFEMMRPTMVVPYFNASTALQEGQMIFTDGTLVAPMSRADVRPFQYVQAQALLEPTSAG